MNHPNARENWFFEFALVAFLALGLAFGASAATAISEPTAKAEVKEEKSILEIAKSKLHGLLNQATLKAKLRAKSGSQSDLKWGVSIERKFEPSFSQGNTSLIDGWEVDLGYKNDFSDNDGLDFGAGIETQLKVVFARQFKGNTLKEHVKLWAEDVRTPLDIPISAEQALKDFEPQEFMMIQVPLTAVLSRNQLSNSFSKFPVKLGAKFALTGEFQIHLFRVDDKRFRIKLIGVRTKTKGLIAKIGYDSDRGGWIGRKLSFTPFSLESEWPESNLMLADYVVDLTDHRAKRAYNALVKEAMTLKSLEIMNQTTSIIELRQLLLADASQLDEIFNQEKMKAEDDKANKRTPKPESDWAVSRRFMGEDDAKTSRHTLGLGFRALVKYEKSGVYTENKIINTDRNGMVRYFLMPMFTLSDESSFLMKLYRQELNRTANLLLETDSRFKVQEGVPGELSFYMDYRDNHFQTDEILRLRDYIRKRVPQEFYNKINWKSWANTGRTRENARVTSLLVIKPAAVSLMQGYGQGDYIERLGQYVDRLDELKVFVESNPSLPAGTIGVNTNLMNVSRMSPREYFQEDIVNEISPALAALGNANLTGEARQNAFLELRRNPLWQEIGGGFLLQFMVDETKRRNPKNSDDALKALYENMYYETTWSATDKDGEDIIDQSFGQCGNRRLYQSVMYIYNVLHNRELDMRLLDSGDADLPSGDNSCNGSGDAKVGKQP